MGQKDPFNAGKIFLTSFSLTLVYVMGIICMSKPYSVGTSRKQPCPLFRMTVVEFFVVFTLF